MDRTPIPWDALTEMARQASKNSYSPYSRFAVGAALITREGSVYFGCNIENASFGLTNCAERTAVFKAVSQEGAPVDPEGLIAGLVVYTPTDRATAPCGACRQVIAEFGQGALIRCVCDSDHVIEGPLAEFLPHSFGAADLEEGTGSG